MLQSGQFVNFTNNQGTLGGKLRLNEKTLANGGHKLTGNVECVNGGSKAINAIATPGAKASIAGTLGGASFVANFKSGPPAAGAPAPRTPVNLKGTYATYADLHVPGRQVRAQRQRADLSRVVEGRAARHGHLLRHDRCRGR